MATFLGLLLLVQRHDVRAEWRVNMADRVEVRRTVRTESSAHAGQHERMVVEAELAARYWQRLREVPDPLSLRRIRFGITEMNVAGVARRWVDDAAEPDQPIRLGSSLAGTQAIVTFHRRGPEVEVEQGRPREEDLALLRQTSRWHEWGFFLPEAPLSVGERYTLSQSRLSFIVDMYVRRAMEAGGGHFTLSGSQASGSLFGQLESVGQAPDGRPIATVSFTGRLVVQGAIQVHNQEHSRLSVTLTVNFRMLNLDVDVVDHRLAGVRCEIDTDLTGERQDPAQTLRRLSIHVSHRETTTLWPER